MKNRPTPYHRSQRGSALFSGIASLFGALPLSVFPPRKSVWEQSGDDIRVAWQDVGDSLRWAMDEYAREHEHEHEVEWQLQQLQLQLSRGKLVIEVKIMKAQKRGKTKVNVGKEAESRVYA